MFQEYIQEGESIADDSRFEIDPHCPPQFIVEGSLCLRYIGCVNPICFARDAHQVIGVDLDPSKVELINKGISPIVEEGMGEFLPDKGPLCTSIYTGWSELRPDNGGHEADLYWYRSSIYCCRN